MAEQPPANDFFGMVLWFIVAGGITGGLFELFRSWIILKRQTKIEQLQRKTQLFIRSNIPHWHTAIFASSMAKELIQDPKTRDNRRVLFYLIKFLQSHETLFNTVASYFLDDPQAERLLYDVEGNILAALKRGLEQEHIDKIRRLISRDALQTDLNTQLETPAGQALLTTFTNWLNTDLSKFAFDLELYNVISDYEINKLFRGWYEKGMRDQLEELRYRVTKMLVADQRYNNFNIR